MTPQEIQKALASPFPADAVEWKAQTVRDRRALAVAYIDARCVMERLDACIGVAGWQDSYEVLPDGNVICRLALRINGEWVTKSDVGAESEQPDSGDKRKASFSDALKRAAVKFGVGRYLYSLPAQWLDYDPQKRQLVGTPRLPPWALPEAPARFAPAPSDGAPRTGAELHARLDAFDERGARAGRWQRGACVDHVKAAGEVEGLPADFALWEGRSLSQAMEVAQEFARRHPRPTPAPASAGT